MAYRLQIIKQLNSNVQVVFSFVNSLHNFFSYFELISRAQRISQMSAHTCTLSKGTSVTGDSKMSIIFMVLNYSFF